MISSKAIISPKAVIGINTVIKDFAIIEEDVQIGNNCEIHYNAQVESGARIGNGVRIFKSAVVSCVPQDKKFNNEYTVLEIGDNSVIREFATLSRGTVALGKTVIGSNCLIMSYVHVAHDSIVGNNVILANSVNMGGHVKIDDWATVGGMVGIHQFVKIGTHSFIAFGSRVTQDVPPYVLAGGTDLVYKGLNIAGIKRRGFTEDQIKNIKNTYNLIYGNEYNFSDAVKAIKDTVELTTEVQNIIHFIETSERGIIRK